MSRRGQTVSTVKGEGFTIGYEAMSHAAVLIHERGSFGLIMINSAMNNHRNQLINWRSLEYQEKEGLAKRTAGSHLPVMTAKLIRIKPHTHTKQPTCKSNTNMLDSHLLSQISEVNSTKNGLYNVHQ